MKDLDARVSHQSRFNSSPDLMNWILNSIKVEQSKLVLMYFWTPMCTDGIGETENYQRSKSNITSCFRFIWFSLGCCGLCTDAAEQESHIMADKLGSRTSRCLLAESCYTICFLKHQKTSYIIIGFCSSVLLHDTNCFCTITRQSGRSRTSCSFPKARDRIVSQQTLLPLYLRSIIFVLIFWCLLMMNLQRLII